MRPRLLLLRGAHVRVDELLLEGVHLVGVVPQQQRRVRLGVPRVVRVVDALAQEQPQLGRRGLGSVNTAHRVI